MKEMNLINKDTKIYCSFSSNPGNNGCIYFNTKFQQNNINAIYKSKLTSLLLHPLYEAGPPPGINNP